MTDQSLQFPRFYVTAPAPCPYLPGREERKVFTELSGPDARELNEALHRVGFRRSQSVAYRPACEGCQACVSVRVLARRFRPQRRMRRIAARNRDLVARPGPPRVEAEHFALLKRYLAARHAEGGMADMDFAEYATMIENSPVETEVIEYRERLEDGDGHLLAVALTDVLSDGLSMVYSFFEPDAPRRSLGTYMILDHIARTRAMNRDHVYLGYWIAESPKMAYKSHFRPFERLEADGWHPCED
ncbi:MAG: arginyltransferase [Rhodothalassiaceae bacterium]